MHSTQTAQPQLTTQQLTHTHPSEGSSGESPCKGQQVPGRDGDEGKAGRKGDDADEHRAPRLAVVQLKDLEKKSVFVRKDVRRGHAEVAELKCGSAHKHTLLTPALPPQLHTHRSLTHLRRHGLDDLRQRDVVGQLLANASVSHLLSQLRALDCTHVLHGCRDGNAGPHIPLLLLWAHGVERAADVCVGGVWVCKRGCVGVAVCECGQACVPLQVKR